RKWQTHLPKEHSLTGFRDFEAVLKAYPKGHDSLVMPTRSGPMTAADYANESAYPNGKIKRGGITDKLLGEYPNLFADLAANPETMPYPATRSLRRVSSNGMRG